jgi:methionyl aminopeptidase
MDSIYNAQLLCETIHFNVFCAYANNSNAWRTTNEEKRYLERMTMEHEEDTYNNIRKAAEVHRQVRAYARRTIKPGMSMTEIAENIENGTRSLVEGDGFEAGIGFPTGLNVNHIAAHFSPNAGDKQSMFQLSNTFRSWLSIDLFFRSSAAERCAQGRLWSARERPDRGFCIHHDMGTDVREAVGSCPRGNGHRCSGELIVGLGFFFLMTLSRYLVLMHDWEKSERRSRRQWSPMKLLSGLTPIEVGRGFVPRYRVLSKQPIVKCIENLNGHSIHPYRIHGDKSVPIVKTNDQTKMEEGEYFAIETFGSTGRGRVYESVSQFLLYC